MTFGTVVISAVIGYGVWVLITYAILGCSSFRDLKDFKRCWRER